MIWSTILPTAQGFAVCGLTGFAGGAAVATALGMIGHRRWTRLADEVEDLAGMPSQGSPHARASTGMATIAARLGELKHRVDQRHAITGLLTREPLLKSMTDDATGILGVIRVIDFDRLCAFDPALGERFMLAIVDRLVRMLRADQIVAQVDRADLAIWFGPNVAIEAARTTLEVIRYGLGGAIVDGDREILPEIRLCQAAMPDDGTNPQALLARTLALLASRPGNEPAAAIAATDPVAIARERYALEQDLRQAIPRGQLEMRYQPLIDAAEGRVTGAEALIRWFHPTHGQVPPSRFVPVMEAMGLAHEMGMWSLNAAAREARAWRSGGLDGLRVAVNVSGHQFDRDDMAPLVARTLARHSLGPDALEIELTESVAMSDGARAVVLFAALGKMGVRIAIDDFGTGYSSFSTLRTLTFDKIKIDREFVTNVDTRRDSQAICQSIIALGRGLDIRVLAEGVERRAEYEWLRRHGCAHFQGYYFSPPLTGADFTAFVRDHSGLAAALAPGSHALPEQTIERLIA